MFNFMHAHCASRNTETERDCNVNVPGMKGTANEQRMCASVKRGDFRGGNRTVSEGHVALSFQNILSAHPRGRGGSPPALSQPSPKREQAALDEAWRGTHKHTQMGVSFPTIANQGLPAFNNCGDSSCIWQTEKYFQSWRLWLGWIFSYSIETTINLQPSHCHFKRKVCIQWRDHLFDLWQKKRNAPSRHSLVCFYLLSS